MELLQLRYFCQAAEYENFSEVARKNGVPPSDISNRIKMLESELSLELFVRWANKVTLSEAGRAFYASVSHALAELDDAVLRATDNKDKGRLKICINSNRRIVMQAIDKYRRIYPEVEIETYHLAEPLSERFDIIIGGDDESLANFDKTLMVNEDILLAMSIDSPYAKKAEISLSDLKNEPFITLGGTSSMSKLLKRLCEEQGFEPRVAIKNDDPFYVRRCVELGLGVTLVPAFSWQGQFSDRVVLKSIGNYKRDTFIYTRKRGYHPLCADNFVELLKAETRGVEN